MKEKQKTELELKETRKQLIKQEFGIDPYSVTSDELIHWLAISAFRMYNVRKDIKSLENALDQARNGK